MWQGTAAARAADPEGHLRASSRRRCGRVTAGRLLAAGGHVRTPRQQVREWYVGRFDLDALLDYLASFLHDRLRARGALLLLTPGFLREWVRDYISGKIRTVGGEAANSFSLGDIVGLALHDYDNRGLDVVSELDAGGRRMPGGHAHRAVSDGHFGSGPLGTATSDPALFVTALIMPAGADRSPRQGPVPTRRALGHDEPLPSPGMRLDPARCRCPRRPAVTGLHSTVPERPETVRCWPYRAAGGPERGRREEGRAMDTPPDAAGTAPTTGTEQTLTGLNGEQLIVGVDDSRRVMTYLVVRESDDYLAVMAVLEASVTDLTPGEVTAALGSTGRQLDAKTVETRLD